MTEIQWTVSCKLFLESSFAKNTFERLFFFFRILIQMCQYLRVAHRVPVHDAVHVHVPGEEQVPPLEHTGVQTARIWTKYNEQLAGNTFQKAVLLGMTSKDFSFFPHSGSDISVLTSSTPWTGPQRCTCARSWRRAGTTVGAHRCTNS